MYSTEIRAAAVSRTLIGLRHRAPAAQQLTQALRASFQVQNLRGALPAPVVTVPVWVKFGDLYSKANRPLFGISAITSSPNITAQPDAISIGERRHAGQFPPFEPFEKGTARGRDIGKPVNRVGTGQRRYCIPAACDRDQRADCCQLRRTPCD